MAKKPTKQFDFAAAISPAPTFEKSVLLRGLGVVAANQPRINANVVLGTREALQTLYVEIDLSDISFSVEGNQTRWKIVHEFGKEVVKKLGEYRIPNADIAHTSSVAISLYGKTEEEQQEKGYIVLQIHSEDVPQARFALQRILPPPAPAPIVRP